MINLLALLLAAVLGLSGTASGSGSATATATAEPVSPAAVEQVVLDVGHCWIEPVVVAGHEWGVPQDRQVGWGGGLPRHWAGRGEVVVRSAERATYIDDGGAVLPLRPADHPSVSLEGQYCD